MVSRQIHSTQTSVHQNIEKIYQKLISEQYLKPISDHTLKEFENILPKLGDSKFILDTGCGVGESSFMLAQNHPEYLVIGLDRSLSRLQKGSHKALQAKNLIYQRVDLLDYFRLLEQEKLKAYKLCMYYPNPYPKEGDIRKRWYAHPVFKSIINIFEKLEVRTNWKPYLEDFEWMLKKRKLESVQINQLQIEQPISLFEKKYNESNQTLWELRAQC